MRAAALALLVLACGCPAVGPDFERPAVALPRDMPELAAVRSDDAAVKITDGEPWDRWWRVFHDDQLDRLMEDARACNYDVRSAVARVHLARAQVREAFAPLLPQINGTLNYTYQRFAPNAIFLQPATGAPAAPGGPSGAAASGTTTFSNVGEPFSLYTASLNAFYELDFWGRLRRALEAAEAEAGATEEDAKTAQLNAFSAVANAYFDIAQQEAYLAIALDAVVTRQRALDLVQGRVDAGIAAELDLRRAEAELANAQAQVPEAERLRAVAEHQIAILTGRMPNVHFQGKPPAAFDLPPEVPAGIPALLLARRPDVHAAELRVREANARIGAAIGSFLPQITISPRVGLASINNAPFWATNSVIYAINPTFNLPILQGGQVYAQILEAYAQTDQNTAAYYNAVLGAFREVADAIVSLSQHQKERDRNQEYVVAEEKALDLATTQYDQGLVNYIAVLDAQREVLTARQQLVATQREVLSDIVALEKALGGGWSDVPSDAWTPTKAGE